MPFKRYESRENSLDKRRVYDSDIRPPISIIYFGLESNEEEQERFIIEKEETFQKRLKSKDAIGGFERGLIIQELPFGCSFPGGYSEIGKSHGLNGARAYSVAGYFIIHDGNPGNIMFERESKVWIPEEVDNLLGEGIKEGKLVLATVSQFTRDADVPFLLFNGGAFSELKSQYKKALDKRDQMLIEYWEKEERERMWNEYSEKEASIRNQKI